MHILVIEDDPVLNNNIIEALNAEHFVAQGIFDGLLADRVLKKNHYDCIVMDINLPGKSGFDLCRDFRNFNSDTPVLMLTAFSELDDKVKGYSSGADDYLTKPFYMRELILRIQSLTKRNRNQKSAPVIAADDIIIQTGQKRVFRQEQEIILTPREYQILLKLCANKGEIVSKSELIREIWGRSFGANTNTIEVYVNFLRNKIDKPFGKNSIKTKIGYGYYFDEE